MFSRLNPHGKGLLLALSGVIVISPDSLLIRLIGIDLWSVMFLRGLFIAMTLLLVVIFFGRKTYK